MESSFLSLAFIFLLGIIVGVCLFGIGLWYILSFFLSNPKLNEKENIEQCHKQQPTSASFQLPPVLQSKINDESFKTKENCWAFNFILYFLFRELRNSQQIRRWILRKLAMEFDEILATSILGKFFSSITIQSIDMGENFPVINWLKTTKVQLHSVSNSISTLDILVDLSYSGGFTFAIQAETHLKYSAYLSVKIKDVKGKARLQFTTEPYAHWSISFFENPDIDIGVASQLYGKSFSQITSIIAAQLKRSVQKKHTLPMFKIRYKPFFVRLEHIISALVPHTAPEVQTTGSLSLTIVECRGLMPNLLHDTVYATMGIGDFDWIAIYPVTPDLKNSYLIRDVICVKTIKREANLDFTLTQQGDIPVVESVNPLLSSFSISQAVLGTVHGNSMSCPELGIEHGDEVIAVDGKNVSTVKQCIRNFKNSTSMKVVWRVRRKVAFSLTPDMEPTLTVKDIACPPNPFKVEEDNTLSTVANLEEVKNSATAEDDHNTNEIASTEKNAQYLSFRIFPSDNRTHTVSKTRILRNNLDPIFQDTFECAVEESQRFVNITLWSSKQINEDGSTDSTPSSSPAKKNKNALDNTFPFGKDKVLGSLSIPLIDILSECTTTGMGFLVKDYYLTSPDGNAIDAREHDLKNHAGFDPHLCYGKVTLSFLYKSTEDASKRKASLITSSALSMKMEDVHEHRAGNLSPTDETQPHQFIRTHFRSAAVCDYCNKKIWLKEAYTCGTCNMKCHKKCYERCVANTTCRGEVYQAKSMLPTTGITPEIIMTHSEPITQTFEENGSEVIGGVDESENSATHGVNGSPSMSVRRRTLGGLIVSAVQNRSSQLRRVGSATALVPQTLSPNIASKSLPPSPQVSPTFNRKAVLAESFQNSVVKNPFLILDSGSPSSLEEDLKTAVDQLVANPDDDFVSLAKETGRDVFIGIALPERKVKFNHLLSRLQEEINAVSNERMALEKEEVKAASTEKTLLRLKIVTCEEKVKALALLMLHYCAGLQYVQEMEENEKDNDRHIITSCVIESDENEPEFPEYSNHSGLLSNLSGSTACLLEQNDD